MQQHDATQTQTASDAGTSWWDSMPNVEAITATTPALGDTDGFAAAPRKGVNRRRFLQVGAALGGALALNGLQVLSGVKLKPAGATVGTEHTGCTIYGSWNGYNNNTLVCVGAPYSYIYCGSDGWFKNGTFDGGNTQYWPTKACGPYYDYRNAWRWSHGSYRYRCADGYFRYWKDGGWTTAQFKICSQWIGYA